MSYVSISCCVIETISDTEAIAPIPISPQANTLATGGTTKTGYVPPRVIFSNCSAVTGWFHMCVFMAGATIIGL